MDSKVYTFPREDGQQQRVLAVHWDSWEELDFLRPVPSPGALDAFYDIYRQYLVPACPWIFKSMVMFVLPEGMDQPYSMEGLADPLTAAMLGLQKGMYLKGGKPVFRDQTTEDFYHALAEKGAVRIVTGKRPGTQIIPVGHYSGSLDAAAGDARMAANASFFIMDPFDCATCHDHIGIPLGLMVKDGKVENPPLYHREALLVGKDGSVTITVPRLEDMCLQIAGHTFPNPKCFTRPRFQRTPARKGWKITVVGDRVVAASDQPSVPVPAAGFVLQTENLRIAPGEKVEFFGMEHIRFGIQVGGSLVKDGVLTEKFLSRFYNIYHLAPVPYPPSLYPLDFRKARAARIVLGADKAGLPVLLWAEGKAKLGHDPKTGSCGASQWELTQICQALGIVNAVNLDGGGSAQVLLQGQRLLRISDRNAEDFSDAPRPVPMGVWVK